MIHHGLVLACLLIRPAHAAEISSAAPAASLSFADVLRDPDNLELSYRYAIEQVQTGNLRTAVSSLERILLVDPGQHKVRLLYAVVLFRLDSLSDAERELNTLSTLPLPDELRAEIELYKKAIKKRKQRTRLSGTLGVGISYDTNRNASPAEEKRLVFDSFLNVTGSNLRQDDAAVIALATLRVEKDLPSQVGHMLFAALSYFRNEQNVVRNGDLQVYSGQVGAALKTPVGTLTPYGAFDHVRLVQETFLRNQGGGLRHERRWTPRLSSSVDARLIYQDFSRTAIVPVGPERSGRQGDVLAGVSYAASPKLSLNAGYGWTRKSAVKPYNALDRHMLSLGAVRLLGKGRFAMLSQSLSFDEYARPDPLISSTLGRSDELYRTKVGAGTPLGFIAPFLKDFLLTLSYEYLYSKSNLVNFEYENNKFEGMLNYRWSL